MSMLYGSRAGRCWIVGCGPTLDGLKYKTLDAPIFALNAACTLSWRTSQEVWWTAMDQRAFYNVLPEDTWRYCGVRRLISRFAGKRGRTIEAFDIDKVSTLFPSIKEVIMVDDDAITMGHSVAIPAVDIAAKLGFSEVVFAGVDFYGTGNRGKQRYAQTVSWQPHRRSFWNRARPVFSERVRHWSNKVKFKSVSKWLLDIEGIEPLHETPQDAI